MKKELVGEQDASETEKRLRSALVRPPILLTEDAPVVVRIEEFQCSYMCKHCGHEWSEVHETEHKFDAPKGHTGD